MNIFINILLIIFSYTLCQVAHAELIELDPLSLAHCRQQVRNTKDDFPILLIYMHHCPYAKMFMPIFESVALLHPERAFLKFDADGAISNEIPDKCLGFTGDLISPIVIVDIKLEDPETGRTVLSIPIRATGGIKGNPLNPSEVIAISQEELEDLIKITEVDKVYLLFSRFHKN